MKRILQGILARVQRDFKVVLCHLVWMGNHPHIILVAQDSAQCVRFYGEVQKQTTDAVKRLLGLKFLNLWKKNATSVIHYGDLDGVVKRIAYLYANPARAGLVDSIERYPGLSSWQEFQQAGADLSATHTRNCPWIRSPAIPKLPARSLTSGQDLEFTARLERNATVVHELTFCPNAWMRAFGVSNDEVKGLNERILSLLREMEEEARQKRALEQRKPMGEAKLVKQPLSLDYVPQKHSCRIFVYAADARIRQAMIDAYRHFCELCQECYQRWKQGDYRVKWPPGAFLPAMPPRQNCLYVS